MIEMSEGRIWAKTNRSIELVLAACSEPEVLLMTPRVVGGYARSMCFVRSIFKSAKAKSLRCLAPTEPEVDTDAKR